MDYVVSLLVATASSIGICISFRTPVRHLWISAILASVAILLPSAISSTDTNRFVSCLALACLAHLLARLTKSPAQGFLVPAFIFLVPGGDLYRAISALNMQATQEALLHGLSALNTTLHIIFAVLIANWIVPSRTGL